VFTKEDDGLAQDWNGRVFLNPPYGDQTEAWMRKMHFHRNGVALVFARTDNKWFHYYATGADAMLFFMGRIAFVDADGATGDGGAGSGSMLLAWGEDNARAIRKFRDIGFFVQINKSLVLN
jgi:hypothetical protein